VTDAQKQALHYLAQVASDYVATLAPSAKGPTIRECQAAIKALEAEPAQAAE
jgi:hypothetical protein